MPDEVLEALRRYDTPTLANAIEEFDVRPRDEGFANIDVRCMFPELGVMVGYAATAAIRARGAGHGGDHAALWSHVRQSPPPRVVVVQDLDDPPAHGSLWGEVNASVFPSGDHFTISTPVEIFVTGCASPPSIDSTYTCESPLRADKNAIFFPSGDHLGDESFPVRVN